MASDTPVSSQRLVVLCSGWGKWDIGWWPMQRFLTKQGYDVVICDYDKGELIEDCAEAISAFLSYAGPAYEHITFVGHSMGGLIGRVLVQELHHPYIDAFVAWGAPHHGSAWSVLAPWSQTAAQMRPGSEFLTHLNDLPAPTIPCLSITGGVDYIVWPREHQMWKSENVENISVPWVNHVGLLFSPRTWWETLSWLTFDLFGEPAPRADRRGLHSTVRIEPVAQLLGTGLRRAQALLRWPFSPPESKEEEAA